MNFVTFNISKVRRVNRSSVLEVIKHSGPITRAAVARKLSMSRSAVSACIDELLSEGIVKEGGAGESTARGGRRSVMLEFVPTAKYAFGIDIGGTKTIFMLTDLNGNFIAKEKIPTHAEREDCLKYIGEEAERFLKQSDVDVSKIVGTGIGVPATTDYENGFIVNSPALQLRNVDVRGVFGDILPNPIYVDNDVNMAVVGEKWQGNGAGHRDVILIAIGTGLGAGIILDEQVHHGANGFAGEIGYFHVDPLVEGYVANPENFGPLEQFATGTGIREQAIALLPQFPKSVLHHEPVTSESVFAAASEGDELATLVIRRTVQYLSFAIANSVALLNPNIVLIGGGVSHVGDSFIEDIDARVRNLITIPTKVMRAKLGGEAGAVGAAAVALLETNNLGFTNEGAIRNEF